MSDPERLRSSSDSEMERLLLRSGRGRAPEHARQRAILAATAVLGTTSLAAAATGMTAKAGSVLSLKWLAVVGVVGLGAATAAAVVHERAESAASRRAVPADVQVVSDRAHASVSRPVQTAPPVEAVPSDTAPQVAPAIDLAPSPSPTLASTPTLASAPALTTSAPATTSVHAELATLEKARAALAAGEPARALSILDAYGTSFPRASMAPEATVLRIEALVRAGDPSAARRVGDAFLASHPQSPYTAHVRSLLGLSNP